MQSFLLLQLQIHEKKLFNPLHPDVSMHILHTVSYSFGAEKGNLLTNQQLLLLVIISFDFMTFMFHSGMTF